MFAVLYIAVAASADTCGSGDIARTVGDFQGCTYQQTGNVACFSSGGFNSSRYTPNLECTIALCQDVKYYYNGFSIEYEKSCSSDALIFAGIKFCGYGDTPSVKDDGWTGTPQNDDMTPSSWLVNYQEIPSYSSKQMTLTNTKALNCASPPTSTTTLSSQIFPHHHLPSQ